MIEQLKTIREALAFLDARFGWSPGEAPAIDALRAALSELEAMAGEPVAWYVEEHGDILDIEWNRLKPTYPGNWKPLYEHPPAQHPPKLEDIEQYRMQMAGISTAAMGYWKEGDSIHPDYDTPALRDVAKLYAQYDALYKAQQPQADEATAAGLEASINILSQLVDEQRQLLAEVDAVFGVDEHGIVFEDGDSALIDRVRAHLAATSEAKQPQAEAVQPCGHPMSLLLRSAESNEPLYCEACDDKSGRHDAERRETELLDANRRLQEKIGSADALKLHAIEELCQLGYTVKDGELFPPDHLHKLVEAAGHPLAAPQQAEAVPPDVVRDAAPIPDHELVTMYDERPTSDLEMIEFAREVERRHGIGVQPQHITDGSPCWCNPDVAYTDPETGASVIVHRRPQ